MQNNVTSRTVSYITANDYGTNKASNTAQQLQTWDFSLFLCCKGCCLTSDHPYQNLKDRDLCNHHQLQFEQKWVTVCWQLQLLLQQTESVSALNVNFSLPEPYRCRGHEHKSWLPLLISKRMWVVVSFMLWWFSSVKRYSVTHWNGRRVDSRTSANRNSDRKLLLLPPMKLWLLSPQSVPLLNEVSWLSGIFVIVMYQTQQSEITLQSYFE